MIRSVLCALIVVCVAVLLSARLGHAALWDDEANTALFAASVWRTGDTQAVVGHNVVAYSQGNELEDLKNRVLPPLQYYVDAPAAGLFPGSPLAARLPFALCGLLTVALLLRWLVRAQAPPLTLALFGLALVGNVSFFLYARQCRYYALAILLSTAIVGGFEHRTGRRRELLLLGLWSFLLWSANYMAYVALYACLVCDHLVFTQRHRWSLAEFGRAPASDAPRPPAWSISDAVTLFAPQWIAIALLSTVYSPLGKYGNPSGPLHHLRLFLWNLRDLNAAEMGVGALLLLAPILGVLRRDRQLLRGALAILVYAVVVAMLSPQPEGPTRAFVRYLAPVLPLCILVHARTVAALTRGRAALAVPLALCAFGTNLLHGGPLSGDVRTLYNRPIPPDSLHSTPLRFLSSLIDPPPSTYATVAAWVRQHVRPGQSVWVQPGYATYPLMYAAPAPVYAWQIGAQTGQFRGMDDIHVLGKRAPDFIVVFGPKIRDIDRTLARLGQPDGAYVLAERLDTYWYDLTRPELFWHAFSAVRGFDRDREAVYVLRRAR